MFSGAKYFATSDHVSIRYAFWAGENERKGSVLLLNGRSEFLEKYREPIQKLLRRGFDVFSLDWRGQGLSSRLLPDCHKGHVDSFDDYLSDLKDMARGVIVPCATRPLVVMAHSMGAHLALRWMQQAPEHWDRAVLTSPMIDIDTRPFPKWFVRLLVRAMVKAGRNFCYAPGNCDYDPEKQVFQGNKLTSDPERFNDHLRAVRENPNLAVGGVTYGWLSAALQSIDILQSPGFAASIEKPVLVIAAETDRIVSVSAQKRLCSMMKNCEFKLISQARHEILKESDVIQKEFWSAFDSFAVRSENVIH